jgi:hypothetical protein
MTRQQLALIATDVENETARGRAAALRELENRYPCRDCGAPAGSPCRPEYGCMTVDDRVPEDGEVMPEP